LRFYVWQKKLIVYGTVHGRIIRHTRTCLSVCLSVGLSMPVCVLWPFDAVTTRWGSLQSAGCDLMYSAK